MLLLTSLALAVHGYHLGSDDGAIYVPAIKQVADPTLYPFGSEFFMRHAHLSLFPYLVGQSSRISHVPVDTVIFIWHIAGVLLLLAAAWRLVDACFVSLSAKWGGVALLAAVLTVPVAGTALVLMDPYLTARSLSTPASLFAVGSFVSGKQWQAAAWLLLTGLVHPQMGFFAVVLVACIAGSKALRYMLVPALPGIFHLEPAQGPAREALLARTYFWLSNWAWYEWLGLLAPIILCWRCSSVDVRGTKAGFRLLLRAIVPFSILFTVAGLLLTAYSPLENLVRLQPLRAFHLVYLIFFVLGGALFGEYVLRDRQWRWLAVFVPLAVTMWFFQKEAYPNSLAIEWPGARDSNRWSAAFYWVRENTSKDAVFALDPGHMLQSGEDMHGFRAISERSMLADAVKDSGAVSLFPNLAEDWKRQVDAQQGLEQFRVADFERLARLFPVTWIITRSAPLASLSCPYQQNGISVCHIIRDERSP